jgi:hypothetical protein
VIPLDVVVREVLRDGEAEFEEASGIERPPWQEPGELVQLFFGERGSKAGCRGLDSLDERLPAASRSASRPEHSPPALWYLVPDV